MLKLGDEHLVSLRGERKGARDQVDPGGRAGCENDLLGLLRVEELRRRPPRSVEKLLRAAAEPMGRARAAAAAVLKIEAPQALGHAARLERRAGAVQIDEAAAVDPLF